MDGRISGWVDRWMDNGCIDGWMDKFGGELGEVSRRMEHHK